MKSMIENIYDFIYNLGLPIKHKYNIKKTKSLISTIKKISATEGGYAKSIVYLRKIDPFLFEELIMTALQNQGHRIKRNKKYTGDGGFDGNVRIKGVWHAIQCKRYANSINPSHVKEFTELTKYGLFVHTGRTGNKSHEYCVDTDIKFISGSYLIDLILGKSEFGGIK